MVHRFYVLDFSIDEEDAGRVTSHLLLIVAIGAGIGFLGGLLGKGGSALATPILVAFGIPPVIALVAPLPATVPGTLVAADGYRRKGLIDRNVLVWSLIAGVPATIVGAVCSTLDRRRLAGPGDRRGHRRCSASACSCAPATPAQSSTDEPVGRRLIIAVAVVTGLAAGLLANSGGFLLAPLFIAVLGMAHQAGPRHLARRRRRAGGARHARAPGARPHRLGVVAAFAARLGPALGPGRPGRPAHRPRPPRAGLRRGAGAAGRRLPRRRLRLSPSPAGRSIRPRHDRLPVDRFVPETRAADADRDFSA